MPPKKNTSVKSDIKNKKEIESSSDESSEESFTDEEGNEQYEEEEFVDDDVEDDDEVDEIESDDDSEKSDKEEDIKTSSIRDTCIYDEDDEIGIDEDEVKGSIIVPKEERKTKPKLNYYEKVYLKQLRVSHLNRKAKPLIKNPENLSTKEIADIEIKEKIVPFKIRRTMPDGKVEIWDIDELEQNEEH